MRPRRSLATLIAIAAPIAALVWLNAYWCREVFFLDHFGQMQSIRGFWEALARLGHFYWAPQWWPYSYDGMPFEYAYPPGVPGLIAAVCKLTGWSTGRAFGVVAGFVFCIGPVALFWMAREVTQRTWWSFITALAYSLLAPAQLLVPDAEFRWRHVNDAPRVQGVIAWDEVPHQLGLACVLLSVAFLVRGLRGRRYSYWAAGILLSCAMLISAFGGTVGFFFLALLCLSWQKRRPLKNLLPIAACGIAAYLAVCPFYPPSLIQVIRQNANLSTDYGWTPASIWAVLIVVAGTVVLFLLSRQWVAWHMRFFVLLTFVFFAIPFLHPWDLHFLPQAGRYKVELDLVLALLGTFAAARWLERLPAPWRLALAALLLIPAISIVKSHRVYAKSFLRASDVHDTIEYRVASWLRSNSPQQRVMAPGSIGSWMNDFTLSRSSWVDPLPPSLP